MLHHFFIRELVLFPSSQQRLRLRKLGEKKFREHPEYIRMVIHLAKKLNSLGGGKRLHFLSLYIKNVLDYFLKPTR